jgi:hypothetical protein
MASSYQKDFKKVRQAAEQQGWRVVFKKGSGHWVLYAPDGHGLVHAPGTASDRRSLDNVVSKMRRYGFKWKGH